MISKIRVCFILLFLSCFYLIWGYIPRLYERSDLLIYSTFHVRNGVSHKQDEIKGNAVSNKNAFHNHNENKVLENVKVDVNKNYVEISKADVPVKNVKNQNENIETLSKVKNIKHDGKNIQIDKMIKDNVTSKVGHHKVELPPCPSRGENLVGKLFVDQSLIKNIKILENVLSISSGGNVEVGGWFQPSACKPLKKVAIIIPYRMRFEQLKIFLRHMHPFLQRQRFYYRIFVVEQMGDNAFNRAALFNIGFKEALKMKDFDCFVFTDVDLIPEDDRNYYGCPSSPRHMSVAVDKFNYKLPYEAIFGGCGSFSREHFEKINGMSNLFWGWGGEDDDLFGRISVKGFKLTRPPIQTGRYTMIRIHHFQSSQADPNRMNLLKSSRERMAFDGLNTLKYNVKAIIEDPLVTFIKIEIKKSMYNL